MGVILQWTALVAFLVQTLTFGYWQTRTRYGTRQYLWAYRTILAASAVGVASSIAAQWWLR